MFAVEEYVPKVTFPFISMGPVTLFAESEVPEPTFKEPDPSKRTFHGHVSAGPHRLNFAPDAITTVPSPWYFTVP